MLLLVEILNWLFRIYYILIFAYVILSWLPHVQSSPVGVLLGRLVEPYLSVFRRFIPPLGVIDISPIIAFFALHLIQKGMIAVLSWIFALFH
jgi:YggT family protein